MSTAITIIHETIGNALASKNQVYVVLRDVAKTFDKVWFTALKYKISHLELPSILEKTLSNFLDHRSAKIKIGEETSNEIQIEVCYPPPCTRFIEMIYHLRVPVVSIFCMQMISLRLLPHKVGQKI